MNDDFEDLLKRWLRDRGATERSAIEALAGHVATLPPRRRRQPTGVAAAAAVIVALGLAAFALVPRSGSISAPTAPVPPDPAAFAGDPRLGRCGASVETALDVFEMVHARDYRLHLPAMGLSPELDVDAPGFVVVFRALHPFPVLGAPASPGQTRPPRSLAPDRHDVCVLVGGDPATTEVNIYNDVDIAHRSYAFCPIDRTESEGRFFIMYEGNSHGKRPGSFMAHLKGEAEISGCTGSLDLVFTPKNPYQRSGIPTTVPEPVSTGNDPVDLRWAELQDRNDKPHDDLTLA